MTLRSVDGLNRTGYYSLEFVRRHSGESSYSLWVDAANLERLRPVIDALVDAG